ncbi:DEAD/DEAH box helicase [Sulfurihydrogenibium sp.]|uniref:DEAD/DEAH box helicase n=1 Tax=Sulfurihydrogenibium sp. TaxID=2053621 RepID=UPI003D12C547
MGELDLTKAILESWLDYIKEEEKLSLAIDTKQIKEELKFNIKLTNGHLSIDKDISSLLEEKIKEKLNKKEESLEYSLMFFPLKFKSSENDLDKETGKVYPLAFISQTLSLKDLKEENIKEFVERHIESLTVDISSSSSPIVLATVNLAKLIKERQNLNYDEALEWINSLIEEGEPPLYILEKAVGVEPDYTKGIEDRINNLKIQLNTDYDGFILFDYNIMQDTTRHIRRFIENRLNDISTFFEKRMKTHTPIYNYIFGEEEKTFEDYNTPSDKVWLGHATNFPLAKGQALVLQKLEEEENLIAVQGPPGTGKTTLLLNVIAWVLVKRALEVIKGNDFNSLILVTSTARKAVENAARDFEETFIKSGLFYSDFFLDLNNSDLSIQKINNFLEKVDSMQFSQDEYEIAKNKIQTLIDILESYNNLIKNNAEIKRLNGKLEEHSKKLENIENEILNIKNNLNQKGLSDEQILELINVLNLEDRKQIVKNSLSYVKSGEIFSLIRELENVEIRITQKGFFQKIIDAIFGKDDLKTVYLKYKDIIQSIDPNLKSQDLLIFLRKLKSLENVFKINPDVVEFVLKESLDLKYKTLSENKKELEENLKKLQDAKARLESENIKIKESNQQRENLFDEEEKTILGKISREAEQVVDDIFNFSREKLFEINKIILKYSIVVLKSKVLKEKEKIVENLELFRDYIFAGKKEQYNKIISNLEDFYKYLSLVFPVVISTLHSSPKLFSGFDKKLIGGEFNPIFLTFIDEAGMANVYLPFPIISLSEKVISVGDPLQLPPVIPLSRNDINKYYENLFFKNIKNSLSEEKLQEYFEKYSPTQTSVYHRTARCKTGKFDDIGQAVFLDEHRRCQEPIAKLFQELAGYDRMIIKTPELKDEDKEKLRKFLEIENLINPQENDVKNLILYNIKGRIGKVDNTNDEEAEFIVKIVDSLLKAGYSQEDIGIITPFLNQEINLRNKLRQYKKVEIGTVHKFQGKEKNVIIFSTVVCEDGQLSKVKFFNTTPNLLNVAVSRAKHLFILTGNIDILKKSGNYLNKIIKFYEENPNSCVIKSSIDFQN